MNSSKGYFVRFCIADMMLAISVEEFCSVMPVEKEQEDLFLGNCQEKELCYQREKIPLFDIRGYILNGYCKSDKQRSTILVVKTSYGMAGFLVDNVFPVEEFKKWKINAIPPYLKGKKLEFVKSAFCEKMSEQIIYELDMEKAAKMWQEDERKKQKLKFDLDVPLREILREIGNVGVGKAASVLGKMTGYCILIDIPEVVLTDNINENSIFLQDEEAVEIKLGFENDLDGRLIFFIKKTFIKKALFAVLGKSRTNWDDMEKNDEAMSMVVEMANVMAGSYLSAISVYTNSRLYISYLETRTGKMKELLGDISKENENVCVKGKFFLTNKNEKIQNAKNQNYDEVEGHILMFPQKEMLTDITKCFGMD